MDTKQKYWLAVNVLLIGAVIVSFLMAKTSVFQRSRERPVFVGQEMVVQNKVVKAVKAEQAVRINRAVKAEVRKVVSKPVPQPKVLPIMPPKISYRVLPEYPLAALQQGLAGTTVLSVYVGLTGAAEKVSVKATSGVAELDKSAVAAVSQWQFNPAAQGGQALASWFEVPVRFELN